MFQSLKIGRLAGIDVFVHGTFWLLPLFVLLGGWGSSETADLAVDLAVLFAVFGCVALHEVGHAVAASWFGIRTRDITLYPLGGVARLEGMPEKPLQEIVVALAGPAVNVGIAFALGLVMLVNGVPLLPTAGGAILGGFLAKVFVANVGLVLFNLIPAFPMDGGRVLRATLAAVTDRVTATQVAVTVSGVLAVGLGVIGLLQFNLMLVVLAVAVYLMGSAELQMVKYQHAERPRYDWYTERVPTANPRRVVIPDPLNGWEYDGRTRTWTEWRDGFPVRRVAAS